jgi:hypothetical protein
VYKWLRRFKLEGAAGLVDRSSRPHRSPTQLQLEKADIVLELRRTKRMTAAKIFVRFARNHPERLHEFFVHVAVSALDEAFPCKANDAK